MLTLEQPEGAEMQKGPQERILQADQYQKYLPKVYHKNVHLSHILLFQAQGTVISLNIPFDQLMFRQFFEYLENCGGCTGLRDQAKCKYSNACAHIERLAKEENDYVSRASHFENKGRNDTK